MNPCGTDHPATEVLSPNWLSTVGLPVRVVLVSVPARAENPPIDDPADVSVEQRIEQWALWRAAQGVGGDLLNDADQSYGDPTLHAYRTMTKRLADRDLGATAVVCVTMPAAVGVMRAMYDRGIAVGRDVSVCAANDEELAAHQCPSLTTTGGNDPWPAYPPLNVRRAAYSLARSRHPLG